MPIQFACPSCARQYSVKDELAGKSAKCGQCGHKMKIPAAASAAATASTASSRKVHTAAPQPPSPKSAAVKASKLAAASAKVAAKTAAQSAPAKATSAADTGMSSWLDEELETARVEAKSKPKPPPPSDTGCPSCNAPLAAGSVICVKCGYDTRIRGKRSVQRGDEEAPKKRSKLGSAASLMRGSFFSFLGAMLGAIIWAVLAYATLYEFSIVAWGLGGLAGLGMAMGHESDDGTFPGIIAAFMSLLGIIAAKVFIVIIFIAAFVSAAVSEMEIVAEDMAAESQELDPTESQRSALALALAVQEISSQDRDGEFDAAAWNASMARSREAVADLTPEEIEARINALGEEQGLEGEIEDQGGDADFAADEDFEQEDDFAEDEASPTFGSVVGSLFGPMDGLWILLAFFTAYKVGSGEATD